MANNNCNSNSMLVEFVGAAGVGKSFLLARLRESLMRRDVLVTDFKGIRIRRFSVASVSAVFSALWLALLTRPVSCLVYFRNVRTLSAYAIRRRTAISEGSVYLCSEGLFHRIRRFHRSSKGVSMTRIAATLFKFIPPPDVVLVVEASVATIHARRTNRARPGDAFTWKSIHADVQLLADSVRAIENVQESIAPHLVVIRVDVDTASIDETANRIANVLENILSRPHSSEWT
jgi:hypothetical protein